uniref:Uncharacterized protein n=1 Tax=Anguilla anguilla TaxID=7936 RepID=A0A0E9PF65_ANGAN
MNIGKEVLSEQALAVQHFSSPSQRAD